MRLIDMKRRGLLSNEYYIKLRELGHSDNLSVSVSELMKMLGVDDLTGATLE